MQITKNKVVSFDYRLTDDDGQEMDSSEGQQPLMYLHGAGTIIPGLERAMEGRASGAEFSVCVEPADAYGARNEGLETAVSREHFADVDDLELGMQFRVPTENGDDQVVTVVEIGEETVTIDGNHPLAGVRLNFEIAVRDVRDATEEEIEHGHAHGPGGHHHD